MALTVFVGIEAINRFCYFFDELLKIKVEHGGSFIRVLKAAFSFNIPSGVIVIGSLVFCLIIYFNTEKSFCSFCTVNHTGLLTWKKKDIFAFFFALVFAFFLVDLANIRECRSQKIENMNRLGGLDYGSAMACSYFYGYLKIILPADGKENKGLLGRIEEFEDNELKNQTFPVKKLFILIPASFYIPPNLKEISNEWLEPIPQKLSYISIDRAGVARRPYKNTAYKIHPGGYGSGKAPIYVVTEGATPMMTFFEAQQYKHRFSDYDERGKRVNPGEILLRRIQEKS
ncbi:stimulator of interferon genes protein isoform X2 [Belonocnema kinseyi]|uniref:stimulator of interferon genes protein isoform X2 n=1 Tax=Belonocnema kinseyi TaxID=2817044 RepID=UPI00143D5798|nr:stimulator of interferon genes protein isoform X2 [Belonocnema kinseyi]